MKRLYNLAEREGFTFTISSIFAFVSIYFILLQIIENLQFISFRCADEVVRS